MATGERDERLESIMSYLPHAQRLALRAELAQQAATIAGFELREKAWNESALMESNLKWAEEAKKVHKQVQEQAATIEALREALEAIEVYTRGLTTPMHTFVHGKASAALLARTPREGSA